MFSIFFISSCQSSETYKINAKTLDSKLYHYAEINNKKSIVETAGIFCIILLLWNIKVNHLCFKIVYFCSFDFTLPCEFCYCSRPESPRTLRVSRLPLSLCPPGSANGWPYGHLALELIATDVNRLKFKHLTTSFEDQRRKGRLGYTAYLEGETPSNNW